MMVMIAPCNNNRTNTRKTGKMPLSLGGKIQKNYIIPSTTIDSRCFMANHQSISVAIFETQAQKLRYQCRGKEEKTQGKGVLLWHD